VVGKKVKAKQDNMKRNVSLLVLFIIAIGTGAAFAFAVFGPSSAWEADVEITGVGYDGNPLLTTDAEIEALGGFPSARIVKVDFDGNPDDGHPSLQTITYTLWSGVTATWPLYTHEDMGMIPKVDFAVGQAFLADEDGNRVTSFPGIWEDVDNSTGKVHFYFGFSVAFTTRATFWQVEPTHVSWTILDLKGSDYLWMVDNGRIPDISEVSLSTTIDLRVTGIGDFQYVGRIENIETFGDPRARYTISPESSGIPDTGIDAFNLAYDWKAAYEIGMAKPRNPDNPVQMTYNIIDSESENMASITTGARLRPGIDGNKGIQAGDGDALVPGGPLTFAVDDITVYDVELIYNFLCDVTLNGIPMTAKGGWLSGRIDEYFIPPKDPEPPGFDLFWILVIGLIAVVCLNEGSKRRGVAIQVKGGG